MKELIERLRSVAVTPCHEAANTLERLTAGDVEMPPMPFMQTAENLTAWCKDYGDQRAAAAVLSQPVQPAAEIVRAANGSLEAQWDRSYIPTKGDKLYLQLKEAK